MTILYAIPTYKCNLNCNHCELHLKNDNFDEIFYDKLKEADYDKVILFGGEPTLYRDRLLKCFETNKITSIATNLINLDEEIIQLYKKYNIDISTSWNPNRFTESQYNTWINNLKLLEKNNLSCVILITLTEDLLNLNSFDTYLKEWDNIKSVFGVLFEPLIDYNMKKTLHEDADKWLCNLYDNWNYSLKNLIISKLDKWKHNCNDIKTLQPNGEITKGCPQYKKYIYLDECLNCSFSSICNPCKLQHICSFPKQLYNKVFENEIRN